MSFSRKQQQVLGVLYLLYGIIWVVWGASSETTIDASQLVQQDPPELMFYIDPPLDLNTSSCEELQLLPSIGPVLAERIISYRNRHGPFTSLDSLKNVKGIGPKTIEKLRYYLEIADCNRSS